MNTLNFYTYPSRSIRYIFLLLTLSCCQVMANSSAEDEFDPKTQHKAIPSKPQTPQALFDSAQAAVQAGNYPAAISALEKILQDNPGLANIRLELGVLYRRIGQYDLAERYINEALKAPNIPEEVRAKAQSLLQQTEAVNKPYAVNSKLSVKTIYDSNANAKTSERSVILGGTEYELNHDALGQVDSSLEVSGAIQGSYEIEDVENARIEAGILSYNRFYNTLSQLDTNVLDANAGVRFNLDDTSSIKPYLSFNGTYLDHDAYKAGQAFGISSRTVTGQDSLLEVDTLIENQKYANSNKRPTASLRDGLSVAIKGQLTQQITPSTHVYGKLGFALKSAEVNFESFDEISAGAGLHYEHDGGQAQGKNAVTSLAIDWRKLNYAEADAQAGFTDVRKESRTIIRLNNNQPINENFSFDTSFSYTNNDSEITLYDYDNWSSNVGLSFSSY